MMTVSSAVSSPLPGYLADSLPGQILYHMGIVDQIPQHPTPAG